MSTDLRLGRWQEVLIDVENIDCLCTDPPYSERTHSGHGTMDRHGVGVPPTYDDGDRREIGYTHFSSGDVEDFIAAIVPRVRGWTVCFTDHLLAPVYEAALEAQGRYVFAPLPCLSPGSTVRLGGDGPSSWTTWAIVSRPRTKEFQTWGTLPGGYVFPPERGRIVVGGKPLALMRAIIRDYTRPGDLVVDPCAGGGTTLLAAAIEGRRAIGAEMDPDTFAKAKARLERGYTPEMFT